MSLTGDMLTPLQTISLIKVSLKFFDMEFCTWVLWTLFKNLVGHFFEIRSASGFMVYFRFTLV